MIKFTVVLHNLAPIKEILAGIYCCFFCRYRILSHRLTADKFVNVMMILKVLTLHLSIFEPPFDHCQ